MKRNQAPSIIWRDPKQFIAFGFGVGALPYAPGTFGTVVGIPFYLLFCHLPWLWYTIITLIIFALSCWLCDVCEKEIGGHDHKGMVIDEIVGYMITMIGSPCTWQNILLGFLLFRLFDIWKPWPISVAYRKINGGFGVMFDDLLAAVAAAVVMCGIRAIFIHQYLPSTP